MHSVKKKWIGLEWNKMSSNCKTVCQPSGVYIGPPLGLDTQAGEGKGKFRSMGSPGISSKVLSSFLSLGK